LWNGPRGIERAWNEQREKQPMRRGEKGSATVEAAVVLPVFVICLFTLAYIVRIFMAYHVMQSALQSVASRISSASYYYYVSGLKDYADRVDEMGKAAADTLRNQADTVIGAVDAFRSLVSGINDPNPAVDLETRVRSAAELGEQLVGNTRDAVDLIRNILKDPGQEAKLLMTVFAQKAAYATRKEMVCLAAGLMLEEELKKRANNGMDAKKVLGIRDISFGQSQIFGDGESLEFIITYTINPPVPFGLAPKLTLSNRVKVIGWTSGRGPSVRTSEQNEDTADSIWVRMDNEKQYWDRGLAIEDMEVERLKNEAGSMRFKATSKTYPAVDAFIYDEHTVRMFDVFTLNPFMKTYQNQPGRIKSEIKKHGKRLMEFDFQNRPETPKAQRVERIVVIILPENAREAMPNLDQLIGEATAELKRIGIAEVRVRYDYGGYTRPEDSEGQEEKEAA